jgi:hypothetical protein
MQLIKLLTVQFLHSPVASSLVVPNITVHVRFGVLTAVPVFWAVTPCSSERTRRSGGIHRTVRQAHDVTPHKAAFSLP